ncbi:MAG: transglutaminase domain-containing protein [Proteobacteria bacterium]|nr:transglutaminase domain-containing protein [Pseudomonadota bacterium]
MKPTFFIDSDAEPVKEKALELTEGVKGEKEKAKRIFYFVRDEIKYNALSPRSCPETFRASYVLSEREGYCVQKAVLLVALSRAAGIPARLRFAEIRNHFMPPDFLELRGTNVFPYHGYTDLYLTGTWIKATPTYDLRPCQKAGLIPVDFDGEHDAMLPPYTRDGRPHIEYVKDRGPYKDLPFGKIQEASILAKKMG